MAVPLINDFLNMLEQSRLFEAGEVQECLKAWRDEDNTFDPDAVMDFASWLVKREKITQWQLDNILAGKYKGFFLGAYKLLRVLGAGGMSSVYLAEHSILQRQVAIKVLPKSRVTSESSYLERFLLEAQAAAALDHPNIVCAYDVDNEGGSIYYLVMEYVKGTDLLSLVKKEGPLDIYKAADYMRQAAIGLQHAHDAGLIHRDMKPANLLVNEQGVVRILDLGLARFTDEKRASLTVAYDENVLGTADYLAPEQARNSHTVDSRADIYGLGCTFYCLLVGHVPFPEGTLPQRIWAHQKKMPKRIQDERPEVPDDLAEICWRMMAKDPNDRQQTATEVADDLTEWLLDHGQKVDGLSASFKRRPGTGSSASMKELFAIQEMAAADSVSKKAGDSSKKVGDGEKKSGIFGKKSGDSTKKIQTRPLFTTSKPAEKGSGSDVTGKSAVRTGAAGQKAASESAIKVKTETEKAQEDLFLKFLNQKQRFSPTDQPKATADSSSGVLSSVLNFSLGPSSSSSTPGVVKKGSGTTNRSASSQNIKKPTATKSSPAVRNSATLSAPSSKSGTTTVYKPLTKAPKGKKLTKEAWIAIGVAAAVILVLVGLLIIRTFTS